MKYNKGGETPAIILSTTPCSLGCIHACKVLVGSVALLSYAQALFSIYISWRNSGGKWSSGFQAQRCKNEPVAFDSSPRQSLYFSAQRTGSSSCDAAQVYNLAHPSWKAAIWKFSRSPCWETNHSPLRRDKTDIAASCAWKPQNMTQRRNKPLRAVSNAWC